MDGKNHRRTPPVAAITDGIAPTGCFPGDAACAGTTARRRDVEHL